MKRLLSLFCLFVLTLPLLLFTGCGEKTETVTLNVFNWGQYISDGSYELPDTNAMFEEYFNEFLAEEYGYKIKVNYSTYASNEDMYNKLASGSASYDVIVPSEYMIERMISENMLTPLDKTLLPNLSNIDEKFLSEYGTYDVGGVYSVPYTFSMVGIIYNSAYVDEEDVGSWDLLWNEKYAGKILQFNNPRDALGTALYRLGYSVNTTDHAKWTEAQQLLIAQKPLVQAYVMDEIFNKMGSASSYIAPYYSGDYFTMLDTNEDLLFYYPEEGTNIFVDAMCIPTCAKNVEAAHAYIDFMLTRDPAVANALYTYYGSPNKVVREDPEYIEEMGEEAMDILYGNDVFVSNFEDLKDVETDKLKTSFYTAISNTEENGNLLDFTNALWAEIKTENSIEPWIIVADAVIVGALAGALLFSFLRKKHREKYY
ncbi:MAG: spermidine/putrescine ABC transporter substrate-binding protein [Clostridia bacterium]|nr:spermidine/putrescine ABC transporter substrate-binding protein [Clostridia bacterium]